ncbi:hypothetical protein J2W27_006473 [Variovorax boronicumulans]|nr:hypothetical protein [Variovorax boronicumulans]
MLITTEARGNAANHAKDMGETTQRLKAAQDQHQGLAEAAATAKAQSEGEDQANVAQALKGLPLLFTRYAAAYSTNAEGLAALDQLRPSGQLQSKPGNVPLEAARYGLRMLRAGFLYIRIKRPGLTPEWSGYVVHPHGYLTAFDVKNPQDSKAHPACEVEMRGANMSMVWVSSNAFLEQALGRYDRSPAGIETGDGARCAGQICAILEQVDTSPRGRSWYGSLDFFKGGPKNIVWRMATLNNEEISQELQRVMESMTHALPAATSDAEDDSTEESARKQRAYADMLAALKKIPKTLKGSQTLLDEGAKVLDPKVPLLQKFKSLQTIAKTARENVHSVWAIAVLNAAKHIEPSAREAVFAKAQVLQLAHGLGPRAIDMVKKEKIEYDEALRTKGQRVAYSNKRNPEPGSRSWNRKYAGQARKLDMRLGRMAEERKASAATSRRIPVVFGAVETMSLLVSLQRANERSGDPRAGAEAASAIFAGMGAWSSARSAYYESNLYNRIQADLSRILPARLSALSAASGMDLHALKTGAAHYVALGTLVGAGVDLVAARRADREGESTLAYAYIGRAISASAMIVGTLGKAYQAHRAIAILGLSFELFRASSVVGLVGSVVMTYAIEKMKSVEWIRWLETEPFRREDVQRIPFSNEDAMQTQLANVVAGLA